MQGEGVDTEHVTETIRRAREQIEAVAVEDGRYAVACTETGVSPDPVTGCTFETFAAAELACLAARRYRSALGRLDPSLTEYALAVTSVDDDTVEVTSVRERTVGRRENGLPTARQTVTLAGGRDDEWLRVENGPVVHFSGPDALLDDEVVARQLDTSL
jgi:hypothetical protein